MSQCRSLWPRSLCTLSMEAANEDSALPCALATPRKRLRSKTRLDVAEAGPPLESNNSPGQEQPDPQRLRLSSGRFAPAHEPGDDRQPDAAGGGFEPLAEPWPEDASAQKLGMRRFFRLLNSWRQLQLGRPGRRSASRDALYQTGLRHMNFVDRHELVLKWLESDDPHARVLENFARQWADPDREKVWVAEPVKERAFRSAQVLLTWQGPFGEFDKEQLVGPEWPSSDELVTVLRSGHHCDDMERQLKVRIVEWAQQFGVRYWAYSIELCTGTWEQARAQHFSAELKAV